MAKVVVTKELPDHFLDRLRQAHEVFMILETDPSYKVRLAEALVDADALITSNVKINGELIKASPHLKIVSNISVGYDNFDIEDMHQAGIIGTHTPGVLDETVADLTFGLMLSASRRISELDRAIRSGNWKVKDELRFYGADLHHRTLGIIGMGRIGEKIAKRAIYGFGMDVLYFNRRQKPDVEEKLGVQYVELDALLKRSDFVVLVTPLTDETFHLMNEASFNKMKETAFFINVSRGQTVDEDALVHALKTGQIAGAGLDVYDQEPINPDHPLLKLENVTLTPHIGSAVFNTRLDMANLAIENVCAYFEGKTPPTVIPELRQQEEKK